MNSKIKTLEDAFIAEGLDPNVRPDVSMLPEEDQKAAIANFELDVWVRALNNEGQDKKWVPDYKDPSQKKWEHVYYMRASGWALAAVLGRIHVLVLRRPPRFQNAGNWRICMETWSRHV